jgi:hypothetical protein
MNKTQENTEFNRFQPQGKVKTIKGTILAPENAGLRFVLSVANMGGTTEYPLYKIFDKKWKKVREETKGWYTTRTGAYKLGTNNTTAVQSDTWVIQMLCQTKELVTDVKALEDCLKKVCQMAKYEKATVHVSSILLEDVPEMKSCLDKQLILQGVNVYFYEEKV